MTQTERNKMHYAGFKIRFAKLYNWIDRISSSDNDVEYIEREICPFFNTHLPILSDKLRIIFEKNPRTGEDIYTSYVDGKYGDYIGFPKFTSLNSINVNGKIRINPCISNKYSEGDKHYSKIWCILENRNNIRLDGEGIFDVLKSAREKCDEVTKAVGDRYLSFVSESPDVKEYWISFESVVISDEDAKKEGIESLFLVNDKDKFLRSYNNSAAPKQSLSDMTKWLYSEDIRDPLKFIRQRKDIDVEWRVIQNPEASVFYAQKNTDNYLHLLGMGISKKNKGDIIAIDNAFSPQLSTLISVL